MLKWNEHKKKGNKANKIFDVRKTTKRDSEQLLLLLFLSIVGFAVNVFENSRKKKANT